MAFIDKVSGTEVTSVVIDNTTVYTFPLATLTAYSDHIHYDIKGQTPKTKQWADIAEGDRLGASTPVEYCEALAAGGYFFDSTSGGGSATPISEESTLNSTDVALSADATFTGVGEMNLYQSVMVSVATDQTGTLYVEFSSNGTDWDTSLSFAYNPDRINPPHIFEKGVRYCRIRYVNDDTAQTYLRIATSYSAYNKLTSPINGLLAENFDAVVVRPTEYRLEVAMGKRQGRATVSKFGYNKDVDTGSNGEILASFGGAFDPTTDIMDTAQTFTVTYDDANDGSGTTGATQLLVDYLDADFNLAQGVHVLGDDGSDVTSFTGLGINRAVVIANGGDGFNNADITFSATTDGTDQAQIPSEASTTQQCIYHTPIGHKLLTDWIKINTLKLSGGGGDPRVTVHGYSWSRVTETRYDILNLEIDTSVENTIDFATTQPFVIGGREVLYLVAITDSNNTSISARFSGILEREV